MVKSETMRLSRLIFVLFCLWVMPALACNFPRPEQSSPIPGGQELRQTLQAGPAQEAQNPAETATATLGTVTPANPGSLFPTPTLAAGLLDGVYTYMAQSGDTLTTVAARFGVEPAQITSVDFLPQTGYLTPGQVLQIPWVLDVVLSSEVILPDSEVVYSPTAADFDLEAYIFGAGGFLSVYTETLDGEVVSGVEVVRRIAAQASLNPRLLLAFLEYRSGWVSGYPSTPAEKDHPIGFYDPNRHGLYQQLQMTPTQLNLGYYGWRLGNRLALKFPDQKTYRIHPALNPGSVALGNLFSKFYRREDWETALYAPDGFLALYRKMFGDFWERDAGLGWLLPPDLTQPALELPFSAGERWSFTAGPHQAWDTGTPRGALDFSPVTGEAVCAVSSRWATAAAPGVIARSERNTVILDLDGDGLEQTGWVLVYFHLAEKDLISAGTRVDLGDPLGHPSCEGGRVTGKHVHIARKYNGEWLEADGPAPFVLSGWRAFADSRNYQGRLIKGSEEVYSNPGGSQTSVIQR